MHLIAPKFWQKINFFSLLLLPFALIYLFVSYLLKKNISYFPNAKVITVGNLTIGGNGKTPLVNHLAKMLNSKKAAILTRGFGGKAVGPIMVSKDHSAEFIGDEALIHVKFLPTCVAKDRLKGIKFLEKQGFEYIITDDGFQDNRFKKDLNILVIDAATAFGNGFIFPAGPLREPVNSGLKKASLIILIGEGEVALSGVNVPIIRGFFVAKKKIVEKRLLAFAGIGKPDKFFNMLKAHDNHLLKTYSFGDHYNYSCHEIEKLISEAKELNAELITTEKDYVKINDKFKPFIINYMVELELKDQNILEKYLLNLN